MFSLKELFNKQVIVSLDPSWSCPWPGDKTAEDKLWCYEIVGKKGKIYPQSEKTICVSTTVRIGNRLLKLFKDKATIYQKGDLECSVEVPVELTKSVFRYIKPRTRRLLTQGQKEVVRDHLRGRVGP